MKRVIAFICLIACTLIWGTTFIAQDTGMDHIGPFTFNSTRFFVAFFAVMPFVLIFEKDKIIKYVKSEKKMLQRIDLIDSDGLYGCNFATSGAKQVASDRLWRIFDFAPQKLYFGLFCILVFFLGAIFVFWS